MIGDRRKRNIEAAALQRRARRKPLDQERWWQSTGLALGIVAMIAALVVLTLLTLIGSTFSVH